MSYFLFKGSRDYIHGTDLVIYLEQYINFPLKSFDLKIHKKIQHQPKIIVSEKLNKKIKSSYASCKILCKNNKLISFCRSKKKIINRYSYDENLISNNFFSNKKNASCKMKTSLHSVEILVSLTKFWHLKNVKKGKWFFTRLKLKKWFNTSKNKNIVIKNLVNINNNSTISEIYEKNKNIGQIFFSLEIKKIIN